jgi:prepilin-type N-terminal cleavage/methylation domain-containing protein
MRAASIVPQNNSDMPPRKDPGFTLIELLVALAAGSLLLVLLGSVFAQVRDTWVHSKKIATTVMQGSHGLARLHQLVSAGLPSDRQTSDTSFEGDGASFTILTVPPQSLAAMGTVKAEVRVKHKSAAGDVLALTLVPGSNSHADKMSVPHLLSSKNRFSFRYAMRDELDQVEEVAQVRPSGQLPVFIRLLETGAAGATVSEHIFTPQNTTDSRCLFDPVSMACRI